MLKKKLNFYCNDDNISIKNLTIRNLFRNGMQIGYDCIAFYYDTELNDYFCEYVDHFININAKQTIQEIEQCCQEEHIPVKIEEASF